MNKFISGLMILGLLSLASAPSFAANIADVGENYWANKEINSVVKVL